MDGIILCAGYGERCRPLTNVLPKPLFPILGRPLLKNIVFYLSQYGINKIYVNVHHLAEKIIDYIKKENLNIKWSYEKEILGTGGGISKIRDLLEIKETLDSRPFIVHNGDILTDIDLSDAIEQHKNSGAIVTLILHPYKKLNQITVKDNIVLDINNKLGVNGKKYAFTGIALIEHKIFDIMPYNKSYSIIDIYLKLITTKKFSVYAYIANNIHWIDIGSIENYLLAHKILLVDRVSSLFKIGELPKNNIYLGENSLLFGTKFFGFASIGNNCVIEDSELENCIIWDNVKIKNKKISNEVIYE